MCTARALLVFEISSPEVNLPIRSVQILRYIPKNVFFLRDEVLIYDAPRERYIPKNVFFLRDEVLIYDAPRERYYHAKITVSTKNFPRSGGRKCGVKGLVQWRGLMVARMSSSSAGGESATYFTEPPDFHISPISSPLD
jgi:hypothetical protein